jgi:hypothetical protein
VLVLQAVKPPISWDGVKPACFVGTGTKECSKGLCLLQYLSCFVLVLQALKPHIFVSVPRLWNRIYDRVMATMREANPIKRRMFETAFAYKRAALEAGAGNPPVWQTIWVALGQLFACVAMGGGRSFAFTLIPRTGVAGHTYSLHRTRGVPHVECEDPCAVTRTCWVERGSGWSDAWLGYDRPCLKRA